MVLRGLLGFLLLFSSLNTYALEASEKAKYSQMGENLGKGGVSKVRQTNGKDALQNITSGTLKPIGNGVTSGGIEADIDDTKKIGCVKGSSLPNPIISTGMAGSMKLFCITPDYLNFYVYACPASLIGKTCNTGDWYLVSNDKPMPDIIQGFDTSSTDIIENIIVKVNTCKKNSCSVNVSYKKTNIISGTDMSVDGETILRERSKDKNSLEASVLGETSAKQRASEKSDQLQLANEECLKQMIGKFNTGEKISTCDQTKQVDDPTQCISVTECAEILPAVRTEKSCEEVVQYIETKEVSWDHPEDSYGQCTKLSSYKKHCLDSYQVIRRVDIPKTRTIYVTGYGSSCPEILDEEGNVTGYDSPCKIPKEETYYEYADYVETIYPHSCSYTGENVSFECGNKTSDEQQIQILAFITMAGRLPTKDELNQLDDFWRKELEKGQGNIEESIINHFGFHPSITQAFVNLVGRSPNSDESKALQKAYDRWGDGAYSTIRGMSAFDGTTMHNLIQSSACFALDRKLNDTSYAKTIYNYAISGNMSRVLEELSSYAQN